MSDENRSEKIENVGLIFSTAIFVPFPPTSPSSQDPRICDDESSSNIFGNLLITILNLRVPRLQGGGEGLTKIVTGKIENVSMVLKKTKSVDETNRPA